MIIYLSEEGQIGRLNILMKTDKKLKSFLSARQTIKTQILKF